MFLNQQRKVNMNGAILLFSCFFGAVFATIQQNPIATKKTNNAVPCNTHGSRVSAVNGPDAKLSSLLSDVQPRPPSAYCVRISGCTELLFKSPNVRKIETRPFSMGGFNWTLIIEPAGSDGQGTWISTSVAIDPSGLVGENREVYAQPRFLAYKKSLDKYWTIMDTEVARFHQFKTTWGTSTFMRRSDFQSREYQYIFDDDQCVFGVDISVFPYFNKWEVVSIDKTVYGPKSWKLGKISTLTRDSYVSDEFSVGGKKWAFKVYPNGNAAGEGNSLSLYVILGANETLKPYEKVYVRAKLRLLDQKQSKHLEKPILTWMDTPGEGSGFDQFVSFSDLKGFIVDDTVSVQVQFEAISSTSYYSANSVQLMSTF